MTRTDRRQVLAAFRFAVPEVRDEAALREFHAALVVEFGAALERWLDTPD